MLYTCRYDQVADISGIVVYHLHRAVIIGKDVIADAVFLEVAAIMKTLVITANTNDNNFFIS